MKIQTLLEGFSNLRYMGTNVMVGDTPFFSPSELKGIVEKSEPADVTEVLSRISPESRKSVDFNVNNITEAGNYKYWWWVYDDSTDTYHFFDE